MSGSGDKLNVVLNGSTKIALIVGDPIAQVKSPFGISEELAARGTNILCIPAHVSAAELNGFLAGIRFMKNLCAIVVTVPHKIAMMAFCDEVSERARFVNAVNIIRKDADGRWVGDNFDGIGMLDGIERNGGNVAQKTVVQVGAGGAGAAIAFEVLTRGADALTIVDLDEGKRDDLVTRLSQRFPNKVFGRASTALVGQTFDVVINASPCGMRESDDFPINREIIGEHSFVADVITQPVVTELIAYAREKSLKTSIGKDMFETQVEVLVSYIENLKP